MDRLNFTWGGWRARLKCYLDPRGWSHSAFLLWPAAWCALMTSTQCQYHNWCAWLWSQTRAGHCYVSGRPWATSCEPFLFLLKKGKLSGNFLLFIMPDNQLVQYFFPKYLMSLTCPTDICSTHLLITNSIYSMFCTLNVSPSIWSLWSCPYFHDSLFLQSILPLISEYKIQHKFIS